MSSGTRRRIPGCVERGYIGWWIEVCVDLSDAEYGVSYEIECAVDDGVRLALAIGRLFTGERAPTSARPSWLLIPEGS